MRNVVDQVKAAFKCPVAATIGFLFGAAIPAGVFRTVHWDLHTNQLLWLVVIGGLAVSAKTVYEWSVEAFRCRVKAIGFVLVLETMMVMTPSVWLGCSFLALLILVNGISASVALTKKMPAKKQSVKNRNRIRLAA